MASRTWAAPIAALGFALAAETAGAGELFSSPVSVTEAQTLSCTAVNVGRKPIRVNVELFEAGEFDGTPGSPGVGDSPPGATTGASATGAFSAFCRVTYTGNKKSIRASIKVIEDGSAISMMPLQ